MYSTNFKFKYNCFKDFGLNTMNPPNFYGSKMDEDPHVFVDEVLEVIHYMGKNNREKVELDTYQLRDVAQVQYE